VVSFPEVVDFYRLSGDVDYLIRAVVSDIRAYDDLSPAIDRQDHLHDVSSMFTMDRSNRQPSCRWVNASTRPGRHETLIARHSLVTS